MHVHKAQLSANQILHESWILIYTEELTPNKSIEQLSIMAGPVQCARAWIIQPGPAWPVSLTTAGFQLPFFKTTSSRPHLTITLWNELIL